MSTVIDIKKELASELHRAMKKQKMSQSELARRMGTSRAVVHRLLKRDDPSVTLTTISRAAVALGRRVRVRMPAAA
jgi:antitoxin HicB